MNDGIMYIWNVIGDYSDCVFHSCAKRETAEYLRDWCSAIAEDDYREMLYLIGKEYQPEYKSNIFMFSIEEGEVIL